jgi:hypothetical protein
MLDTVQGKSHDLLLSLNDLEDYWESDIAQVRDLENPVKLPNLIDLLTDYLGMVVAHRTVLGTALLWKLPLYKRRTDIETGKMIPLNPDELYRMKILDTYTQMLKNIEQQQAFEDNNALPLSLDAGKSQKPDKARVSPPNLCLRSKTILEK